MYYMSHNATQARETSLAYLHKLLPQIEIHAVASAIASCSTLELQELVPQAARKLGIQFHHLEVRLTEVLEREATLPVLELGKTPRILLAAEGDQVRVFDGTRTLSLARSEWGDTPHSFLLPSPRMTLASLRHHSRVKRVLKYLATERPILKAILGYAVVIEILNLAAPIAVQVVINSIGFGMMNQQLIVMSLLLLLAMAGAAMLRLLQMVMVEHLTRRFFCRTVMDFSERLPALRSASMTNIVHRFFEVSAVDKAFFVLGLDLIAVCLQLLAATVLLAFYHPMLLSFTAIMVVSAWVVVRLPFAPALNRSLAESHAKYELADFLKQRQRDEIARLAHWGHWLQARKAGFKIALAQQAGLDAIQVVLAFALLLLGGHLVIAGQLTLGQLVAAELVAGTALVSLSKLGKQLSKVYDLVTSFEKLGAVVDLPLDESPETLDASKSVLGQPANAEAT